MNPLASIPAGACDVKRKFLKNTVVSVSIAKLGQKCILPDCNKIKFNLLMILDMYKLRLHSEGIFFPLLLRYQPNRNCALVYYGPFLLMMKLGHHHLVVSSYLLIEHKDLDIL